jgi:hypothetical protein
MADPRLAAVRLNNGAEFLEEFSARIEEWKNEFLRHADYVVSFNSRRDLSLAEEEYVELIRALAQLLNGILILLDFDRETFTNVSWANDRDLPKKRLLSLMLRKTRLLNLQMIDFANANDVLVRAHSGPVCVTYLMTLYVIDVRKGVQAIWALLRNFCRVDD